MIIRILIAIVAGIFFLWLEWLSVRALWGFGRWPDQQVREVLGFHIGALIFLAPSLRMFFPEPYHRAGWTFLVFVLGIGLPMPVLGPLFLIGYRILLMTKPPANVEDKFVLGTTEFLTSPQYSVLDDETPQTVSEILYSKDDQARRLAILALRMVDPKKALPLLHKAVQDTDEQVRLLAQTQLNKIIAGIEGKVKDLEAELANPPRPPGRLLLLAEQYHELVYLGLASDVTEVMYLKRVVELLEEASPQVPDNTSVRFLILKSAIRIRDLRTARTSIAQLRSRGWHERVLAPWEAEVHFMERNWPALEQALRRMQTRDEVPPGMRSMLDFWLEREAAR